jgi:hypothetical protein
MLETASNHCQIVAGSLTGEREVDEQTFASLDALAGRLERLKDLDKAFSKVSFSPAVGKLQSQKDPLPVG